MSYFLNTIRAQIWHTLKRFGIEVRRCHASNGSDLDLLFLLTEHFSTRDGKGSVLQIGANDGLMADPVRKCIVSLNLPALLVEPLPDIFARLQKNYEGQPHIYFENVAVSNLPGSAKLFRANSDEKSIPEWANGIASFDKKVILKHKLKGVNLEIEEVDVPVVTVKQLLKKYPSLPPILLLQIDTEGHDFTVIKSAVEAGCTPKIIHYEHKHLNFQDQFDCRELLISKDYQFHSGVSDTIAVRSS
jgi:FkbM family methyltransferase